MVGAHADTEFCFGFGVGGGVVVAGEGLSFVRVLCDHAAPAEWEGLAGRFDALYEFVRRRWGAASVNEGVARGGNGSVEVKCVLQGEVIG